MCASWNVAGLADSGLEVVEQLGIECQHLADPGEHAADDRQGFGTAVQLKTNRGRSFDHVRDDR
jgi:hypothetical protein